MGQNLVDAVTDSFLVSVRFFGDGIRQYLVYKIITGNGFGSLCFLRMKRKFLLNLFYAFALGGS